MPAASRPQAIPQLIAKMQKTRPRVETGRIALLGSNVRTRFSPSKWMEKKIAFAQAEVKP
jgi:hypothetical protein